MTAALHLPAHWDEREWTVDDLASLPEDLRYELIDGRLVLPSPTVIPGDRFSRLLGPAGQLPARPRGCAGYVTRDQQPERAVARRRGRPDHAGPSHTGAGQGLVPGGRGHLAGVGHP